MSLSCKIQEARLCACLYEHHSIFLHGTIKLTHRCAAQRARTCWELSTLLSNKSPLLSLHLPQWTLAVGRPNQSCNEQTWSRKHLRRKKLSWLVKTKAMVTGRLIALLAEVATENLLTGRQAFQHRKRWQGQSCCRQEWWRRRYPFHFSHPARKGLSHSSPSHEYSSMAD